VKAETNPWSAEMTTGSKAHQQGQALQPRHGPWQTGPTPPLPDRGQGDERLGTARPSAEEGETTAPAYAMPMAKAAHQQASVGHRRMDARKKGPRRLP